MCLLSCVRMGTHNDLEIAESGAIFLEAGAVGSVGEEGGGGTAVSQPLMTGKGARDSYGMT
jgi:hypothetical protein